MKKVKWENVLALLLALTYGLVFGLWLGNGGLNKGTAEPEIMVQFEKPADYEDYLAYVDEKKAEEEKARQKVIEKARKKAAREKLKIHDSEELYTILDGLKDQDEVQKIRTEIKGGKEACADLEKALQSLEDSGQRVAFVMLDLKYGVGLAKDPKKIYYSASTIKGPYVCSMVCLKPDRIEGYKGTIEQVVKVSSNSGYEQLHYAFGFEVIDQWAEDTHITTLNPREFYTDLTSVDLGKLWVRNWEFLDSDAEHAAWLKDLFQGSLNSVTSAALADDDTKVYSKAGWIADGYYGTVQNDGAIVVHDGKDPYLLVILSSALGRNDQLEDLVRALDRCMKGIRKKI